MNWFLEKMRLYSEALSGIDDPRGGHLRNLEIPRAAPGEPDCSS